MTVKNCSNCGTTNPADATACLLCNHSTFFEVHQATGNVDGTKVTDEAKAEVADIVLTGNIEAFSAALASAEELLASKACGVCGAPATTIHKPAEEIEPLDGWRRYEYTGDLQYACDQHAAAVGTAPGGTSAE